MFQLRNRIAILAILMTVTALLSQANDHSERVAALFGKADVLALVPWEVQGMDLVCVITKVNRRMSNGESAPVRTMAIYSQKGPVLRKIYEIHTGDWFLTAYPVQENGRFLVGWGTGSAYHFQVYSYVKGRIVEVLDKGSRSKPEIIFDDAGGESLLFTEMQMVGGEWRSSAGRTTVLKWNGHAYKEIGIIPWAKRLQCVTTESCSTLH